MDLTEIALDLKGKRQIPIEFVLKCNSLFKLFFAGKCKNTRKNYKEDLTRFVAFFWMAKNKFDPASANHEDIVDFVEYLKKTRSLGVDQFPLKQSIDEYLHFDPFLSFYNGKG